MIFGSNAVLSLTMLSLAQREDVPKVSYITALDIYLTVCFVFCFATLIQFALVNSKTVIGPKNMLSKLEDNVDLGVLKKLCRHESRKSKSGRSSFIGDRKLAEIEYRMCRIILSFYFYSFEILGNFRVVFFF